MKSLMLPRAFIEMKADGQSAAKGKAFFVDFLGFQLFLVGF